MLALPGFPKDLNVLENKDATSSDRRQHRVIKCLKQMTNISRQGWCTPGSPTTWTTPYTITVDQKATGITVSWNKAQYYDGTQSNEAPFHQVESTYYDENGAAPTIPSPKQDPTVQKRCFPRYTEYDEKGCTC